MNVEARLIKKMITPENYGTLTDSNFDFIDYQKRYYISRMRVALKYVTKVTNV